MTIPVSAYQHGIYPRSEEVVAVTRGLERGRTGDEEVAARFRQDLDDFVATQREARLDYFSDGLLRWQDIFRPLVEATGGLEARTLVRWFDNNSFYRAPEVTGPLSGLSLPAVFENDEAVPEPRVATLPSPYLFSRAAKDGDGRHLVLEVAREILRPVVEGLARRGYGVIQLQEPWLAYFGLEDADWDDLEKGLGEIRDGLPSPPEGPALVLHTYFGDVGEHIERLLRLPIDALGVDLIETDLDSLGKRWPVGLLAGVLDGRSSRMESVDGTLQFVRRIAETVQPAALYLSSNSELEFLPRDLARQKVLTLGEVSSRVKEALK